MTERAKLQDIGPYCITLCGVKTKYQCCSDVKDRPWAPWSHWVNYKCLCIPKCSKVKCEVKMNQDVTMVKSMSTLQLNWNGFAGPKDSCAYTNASKPQWTEAAEWDKIPLQQYKRVVELYRTPLLLLIPPKGGLHRILWKLSFFNYIFFTWSKHIG